MGKLVSEIDANGSQWDVRLSAVPDRIRVGHDVTLTVELIPPPGTQPNQFDRDKDFTYGWKSSYPMPPDLPDVKKLVSAPK